MNKVIGLLTALTVMAPLAAEAQAPLPALIGGDSAGRRRLTLQLDYNGRRLGDPRMELRRHDAALGAAFHPLPWLNLFARAHFGRTDFSFNYGMSEGFDLASKVSNDDFSLEGGLRIGLVSWKILSLDVFASYEIMPYRPRFRIDSAKLGTPFGPYDATDFCRQHADFRYDLSQLNVGVTLHARIWRFIPRLAVQYQRLAATFDPLLDEEAAATIGLFGFDREKARNDLSGVKHVPAVSPGLTVELPYGFALDLEITTTPTEASNYLTGCAGVSWTY